MRKPQSVWSYFLTSIISVFFLRDNAEVDQLGSWDNEENKRFKKMSLFFLSDAGNEYKMRASGIQFWFSPKFVLYGISKLADEVHYW